MKLKFWCCNDHQRLSHRIYSVLLSKSERWMTLSCSHIPLITQICSSYSPTICSLMPKLDFPRTPGSGLSHSTSKNIVSWGLTAFDIKAVFGHMWHEGDLVKLKLIESKKKHTNESDHTSHKGLTSHHHFLYACTTVVQSNVVFYL